MSTHPVIAVATFVGFFILVIPILFRLIHLLPLLVIGCLIPIVVLFYVAVRYKCSDINSAKFNIPRVKLDPFDITIDENWKKECQLLIDNLDASVCDEIYPRNDQVNIELTAIIAFILRDFVQNWYRKITVDQTFVVDLKREFKFIINQLQVILQRVDFSQLLIQNLVQILDQHIVKFNKAMEIAQTKVVKFKELEESDIIVSNYVGLHKAINLESDTQENDIKKHIASLIDKILPQLLDEKEQSSNIVRIIIKEILGTLVMGSVVMNLSDPDFFNQLIESQVTEVMNDRGDVKKLRNFIKESVASKNNNKIDPVNADQFHLFNLTLDLSGKQFNRFNKSFSNSNNEIYLTKCLYYMTWKAPRILQLASNEDVKTIMKFQKRTDDLTDVIQSRLSYLNLSTHSTKSNISGMYSSVLSSSSSINLPHNSNNKEPIPLLPVYSLQEVIHNPKTMDYFSNWMSHRQDRDVLLNYYTSVESLRNPLEYIDMEMASHKSQLSKMEHPSKLTTLLVSSADSSNDDTLTAGAFLRSTFKPQKYEQTSRSSDLSSGLILHDDDLSQADDICALYDTYFNSNALHINPTIVKAVHEFIFSYKNKSIDKSIVLKQYLEARKAILKLQVFTYLRMKQSDFRAFVESDLWLRMCAHVLLSRSFNDMESNISAGSNGKEYSTNGDPLSTYIDHEEDHYLDVNMTGKVSDKVLKAVESALTQIMKDNNELGLTEEQNLADTSDPDITMSNNFKTDDLLFGNKRSSRLVSDDLAVDLFGSNREESIFGDDQQRDNSLFEDEKKDTSVNIPRDNDTDTDIEDMDKSQDDILLMDNNRTMNRFISFAAHIDKLNDEVFKLNKQKDVIEALLKKAEIINNVPETKLLTRSKMSLEREITIKELKREQYLFKDAANSLFDKSSITIVTFLTERDLHGTEYTSYVVKISKYNDKSLTGNSEEWVVKRRFSEFYELHSYLRAKYDFVNSLDFPKRKMVMTFRQDGVVERRLISLRIYLQGLIKNEDVCNDEVFKTFLSNETFDIESIKQHIKQLKRAGNRFSVLRNGEGDNGNSNENSTFIQPITDLILNLFQLNEDSNKWIKGKTIVLMFQQVFGSAIEKFIRSTIESKVKSEDSILEILRKLKTKLWPQNQWRKKKVLRTTIEKENSKEHARVLLQLFVIDTCAKVTGNELSMIASETIWNVVQNETLNRHLMLTLLDEIFQVIFCLEKGI